MPKCLGLVGRLRGHDYQPRYTTHEEPRALPPSFDVNWATWAFGTSGLHELSTLMHSEYHGDVCTRCGHTINERAHDEPPTAELAGAAVA